MIPRRFGVQGTHWLSGYRSLITAVTPSPPREHTPVLLSEVMQLVAPTRGGGWFLDATFGDGGYTQALLERDPNCRVVAVDQDPYAYTKAQALAMQPKYQGRLFPILGRFSDIRRLARPIVSDTGFTGIVYDIGVCSSQIDQAHRGFSYMRDGPLDMRMASRGGHETDEREVELRLGKRTIPASVVVNQFSVDQLAQLFQRYGEERFANRIAAAIDRYRQTEGAITTTSQLADLVCHTIPRSHRAVSSRNPDQRRHPATRIFQSLRIYVNDELTELTTSLQDALTLVAPQGRIAVVTFHSLEDRLVKQLFKVQATSADGHETGFRLLSKRVIKPSRSEVVANSRSASAKLRAIERL
ncbi:hypothetical protein H4R34_001996 [Dimargaris verticillata]|uniref:Ribosomal RNA small subunit methyltransferase H n=1 Tax=Dimargaris verticillata TaxID=2761393 RepID=A0A9W8E9R3_9FUNG|nr:hypothetical protein H4R34_001996 [Dimargaris verticillata]